jgi:hypothetical protein
MEDSHEMRGFASLPSLIELPSGHFVDQRDVLGVEPAGLDMTFNIKDRVIIARNVGSHIVIECENWEQAKQLARDISEKVNAAREKLCK